MKGWFLVFLSLLVVTQGIRIRPKTKPADQHVPTPKFQPQYNQAPTVTFVQPNNNASVMYVVEDTPTYVSHPIVITDPDGTTCPYLEVDLWLEYGMGTLNFWNEFPGHGASYASDGNATAKIIGTSSQINWALANLLYTPSPNFYGTEQLTIFVNDTGSCLGQDANGTTFVIIFQVNSTNDVPILNLTGYGSTTWGGGGLYVAENDNITTYTGGVTFLFSDDSAFISVNITSINGIVGFPNAAGDLMNITYLNDTATRFISFLATPVELQNRIFSLISFQPDPYFQGTGSVVIQVDDLGSPAQTVETVLFWEVLARSTEVELRAEPFNTTEEVAAPWPITMVDYDSPATQQIFQCEVQLTFLSGVFGTLSWPSTTTVTIEYNSTWPGSYRLAGTFAAVNTLLNQTVLTPGLNTYGTGQLLMRYLDVTQPPALVNTTSDTNPILAYSPRTSSTVFSFHVQNVWDPPTLTHAGPYYFDREGSLLLSQVVATFTEHYMPTSHNLTLTIEVDNNTNSFVFDNEFNAQSIPALAQSLTVTAPAGVTDPFTANVTSVTVTGPLATIELILQVIRVYYVAPYDAEVLPLDQPFMGVGYVNVTVAYDFFDPAASSYAIPVIATNPTNPTTDTCQAYLNLYPEWCGCYFVTNSAVILDPTLLIPPTCFFTNDKLNPVQCDFNWPTYTRPSIVSTEFPSVLFPKESAPRIFLQGCCADIPQAMHQNFTRRNEMGLCGNNTILN